MKKLRLFMVLPLYILLRNLKVKSTLLSPAQAAEAYFIFLWHEATRSGATLTNGLLVPATEVTPPPPQHFLRFSGAY